MNEKQRQLLIGVGMVMFSMLAFPPFHVRGTNFGYAFILNPPNGIAVVNVGTLLIQWLFVAAIGFIGWRLLKDG